MSTRVKVHGWSGLSWVFAFRPRRHAGSVSHDFTWFHQTYPNLNQPQFHGSHLIWLVVYLPLWKMMDFVSWDDYNHSQYSEGKKIKAYKSHVPNHQPVMLFMLRSFNLKSHHEMKPCRRWSCWSHGLHSSPWPHQPLSPGPERPVTWPWRRPKAKMWMGRFSTSGCILCNFYVSYIP